MGTYLRFTTSSIITFDSRLYKNIKETLIPVLWMRERGGVDDSLATQLRVLLNINNLVFIIGWILATIGCVIVVMEAIRTVVQHTEYRRLDP